MSLRPLLLLLRPLRLLAAAPASAHVRQARGGDGQDANASVFLRDEVTRVDVTIDPQDLQDFLDNPQSDDFKVVTVRWRNSAIDEVHADVAFRIRGNTSRSAPRKSFKLDFRELVAGRDFHGLEEVNLNGSNNDPTIIRSMVAWEIVSRMGLPGSRTHLVALYFNDTFWSLQTHVEHYDEEFAENWFNEKTGNFYKCLFKGARADLSFVAGEDYTNYAGGDVYREFNNNDDPLRDYTDIAQLVSFINFSNDATILDGLESRLSVDCVLRTLATNVATGNWDDYWYGSNNFYLYFNKLHGRFQFIPYDLDNTLGTDFFSVDWSTRHFDGWGDGGFGSTPAPLVEAVFSDSEWRRQFRRYLLRAADVLQDPGLRQQILAWHALVVPYMDGTIESGGVVGAQPYFQSALTIPSAWNGPGAQDGHRMGLVPFLDARAISLRSQIAAFFPTPPPPTVRINEVMSSNSGAVADEFGEFDDWLELHNFGASAIDLSGWGLSDTPNAPPQFLFADGTILPVGGFIVVWADGQPEQGALHALFHLGAAGEHITLYHNAANGRIIVDELPFPAIPPNQTFGRYPDSTGPTQLFAIPTPGAPNDPTTGGGEPGDPPALFINEFVAANAGAVLDEFGEANDWVEIFNASDEPVDMGGMHLTDDLANPTKWPFPDGITIPARGYLLVWADNQNAQGPLHTNFALSRNGEAIGLFDTAANGFQQIDAITFGAQADDVSEGRLPDGGPWAGALPSLTPGASNSGGTGWMMR